MGILGDFGIGGGGKIFTKGMLMNILGGLIFFIIIGFFFVVGFIMIRNRLKYKIPVTALVPKGNGLFKRIDNLRGAVVQTRKGYSDFEIRRPRKAKPKKLGYVPDLTISGVDDRLTFIVTGDGVIWQQCKESLVKTKDLEIEIVDSAGKKRKEKISYELLVEPIPTDVKAITINNIHDAENLLETNKLKATTIAIGAFILMVLIHALFLFLTAK